MKTYDVVVLGGGPGGYVAAIRSAQLGQKTALVEREQIGGTCLNTGCIPTKTLVKNAEIIRQAKNSDYRGIHIKELIIDLEQTIAMKNQVVGQLRQGVEGLLAANGVTVFHAAAKVLDQSSLRLDQDGEIIRFKNLIIATGSRPAAIPVPGAADYAQTSTQMLELDQIPQRVVIIGGGVIGCEFAHVLQSFGSQVTILEAMPRIISSADEELSLALEQSMKSAGITIKTGCMVKEIRAAGEEKEVLVQMDGQGRNFRGDQVMISIGRTPNTDSVAGLGLEMKGDYIKVDQCTRTSLPHIYAIGDVTGIRPLAHTASHMGKAAAETIAGMDSKYDDSIVPSCIFTSPELAFAGMTEAEARKQYQDINVGRFPLIASGKALAMGEPEGIFKVICDGADGKLLGVHLLGANATEVIGEAAAFLKMGAGLKDLEETIHAHPTIAEALQEAALDAGGRCIHMPPKERQ
ncbi:dihydrolipoyl dehydrogenase [Ihubacter massiliensis]|uniref:Dihydrolipoyl dehydrogenase n=1 Tax=Hominibacterium faecale TaxID=2839743 RepID=A0A9J6QVG9_9FIRM|nr:MULTISPECIES: dihydrolipoyl dehydrogenase [Eubacteriales Family XIII. Incertae Sedis]MCO7121170.1 dihydrolipoyl dehydrogenase [Ihubacter massiliensis]MCU7378086.1 dihydrolipoyl dehydrogenase [Hominibacterium faecale]